MDKARIDILIYCGPSTQYSSISSLSGDTYSILELLQRCALYLSSKADSIGSYDICTHGLVSPGIDTSNWRVLLDAASNAQPVNEEAFISSLNNLNSSRNTFKRPGVVFSLIEVPAEEMSPHLLKSLFQLSNPHFIAVVDSQTFEASQQNLDQLARIAYESHGTLNVIYSSNDGVSAAPTILDRLLKQIPRAFHAGIYMGHLSAPIMLTPDPKSSGWTDVAAKNKLPVELPHAISIVAFVDASLVANPSVYAQFDILPAYSSQNMPPLLCLLEDGLKSKRKFAIVSLGSSWIALVAPSVNFLSLLILTPAAERSLLSAPQQRVAVAPFVTFDRDGLYPDAIAFEFEQVIETLRNMPDSSRQLFYAAEQIRIRARKLGHSSLIDSLVSLLDEERRKLESTNLDTCYVLEELIHLLTVQPQSALAFSGIESAQQANNTSSRMSLQSILS